jgi:hypothetical protein
MCAFVRRIRFALPLILVVAVAAAVLTSVASGSPHATIKVTTPIPSSIRVGQQLVVKGVVRTVPKGTRVALERQGTKGGWTIVAASFPGKHGGFRLDWRVTGLAYRQATLRVAALFGGQVVVTTPTYTILIGPAKVYCKPPVPPATMIPVGDGWIVGGLYGEGGPAPGIFACSGDPYTVTATNSSGVVAASQHVAALHSYTLVVPAGKYSLAARGCHGQATVKAGRQTTANTYCLFP